MLYKNNTVYGPSKRLCIATRKIGGHPVCAWLAGRWDKDPTTGCRGR